MQHVHKYPLSAKEAQLFYMWPTKHADFCEIDNHHVYTMAGLPAELSDSSLLISWNSNTCFTCDLYVIRISFVLYYK